MTDQPWSEWVPKADLVAAQDRAVAFEARLEEVRGVVYDGNLTSRGKLLCLIALLDAPLAVVTEAEK